MKISCMQEDLNKGLSIVKRAVPTKTTLDSLQSVLLAARMGKLKLTATDLALTMIYELPAVVEEPGTCALLVNTFSDFVSKLPQDRIDLDSDTKLHIKCQRYKSNVSLINTDNFPVLQTPEFSTQIKIKSSAFLQALKQVAFAMLNNTAKPQLNGVCLEIIDTILWFAAADTTRLSLSKILLPKQYPNAKIIIPAKTVNELVKTVTNEDKEISIDLSTTQVKITMDNITIQSMLIAGDFPNYQSLVPTDHTTQAIVNRIEFLEALKLAGVFASDRNDVVVGINSNKVLVSSGFEEIGDNESSIDGVVTGPELSIVFNGVSMSEALTNIQQDKISLDISTPASPIVVKPIGFDNYVYVIAPMYKPSAAKD